MSREKQNSFQETIRIDCPMRHENGNCLVSGGFCTAVNTPICEALHNAYNAGKTHSMEEMKKQGYRKQSENTVELPCKIGDTVYIIDEADDEYGEDYVLAVKVLQFFINEHGIAIELALPLGMRLNTWMVVGENVFLTREEAEAKMKGEENEQREAD